MKKQKIILDVDTATGIPARDVDDGLAIALALVSPEMELLGLTTCAGNCRTEESTENSLRILQLAGRGDIPVAEGRKLPFIQDVSASYEYLDGWTRRYAEYWSDVPPLPEVTLEKIPQKAHDFIIEMVKKYPGEVTIVTEGSHTNLALALLVAPEIAPLIKEVIHMGGDVGVPWWYEGSTGFTGDPPEVWRYIIRMNTVYDPEATEIVIRSGIPFTFVTSKVCARVLLRLADIDEMQKVQSPYHQFLANTARAWVSWQVDERGREGAPMWDLLALALAFEPGFCTTVPMRVDVKRLMNYEFPYLFASGDSPQVQVTMDVDVERFERFMVERLCTPLA